MIVLLFFNFVALLLTYLAQKGIIKNGLGWGMALVTVIAAIRYDYGLDYWEYFADYERVIKYYSINDILSGKVGYRGEDGWYLLMYIMKPLGISGFFVLVALISIFQGVVVYSLIKAYVPKKWMVFALFVYLFSLSLYVGSLSGMRQHFAMSIIGCTIPLIIKKKIIPSIVIILVTSIIHTSSLIFLPFIFWGYVPLGKSRYLSFIYISLYIVFLVSASLSSTLVGDFLKIDKFEHYDTYLNEENQFNYFGFGYVTSLLLPYLVSILYLYKNYNDETKKRLVSIAAAGMTLLPVMASVHLGTRLLYYFDFIEIVTIPIAFSSIKSKPLRTPLMAAYSLFLLYAYYDYFHSELRYSSTYFYHSLLDFII